jgi:hypothetical protein
METKLNKKKTLMSNENSAGGIGFLSILTIVFIHLKLTGSITWSWLWVLSPLWLPTSIAVFILIIAAIIVFLAR